MIPQKNESQMIKDNQNLVHHVLKKYFFTKYYDKDDLLSTGNIGLLNAIRNWKTGRSTFSSYACSCIFNAIRNCLRHENKFIHDTTIKDNYTYIEKGYQRAEDAISISMLENKVPAKDWNRLKKSISEPLRCQAKRERVEIETVRIRIKRTKKCLVMGDNQWTQKIRMLLKMRKLKNIRG